MKKKLLATLLVLVLMLCISVTAFADSVSYDFGTVTFTSEAKIDPDRLKGAEEALSTLQPGDDVTLTVTLTNKHKETVDWYMKNPIQKTLEDGTAKGGAYTYELSYAPSGGASTVLYSSDKVGGETSGGAPEGLKELDSALKDYFYLGTMASGGSGVVTLKVALDGETMVNNYQGTDADVQMQFAAEITPTHTVVVTGDSTNFKPYYIVMGISGLLALALAVDGVVQRKKAGRKSA